MDGRHAGRETTCLQEHERYARRKSSAKCPDVQTDNPEDPQEIAVREGVHERIQAEIQHEDKEAEVRAGEMLEVPPEWNKFPDLMMEDEDVQPASEGAAKQKIDEVAQGQK